MSESIKINMPFDKWCKIQKDFEKSEYANGKYFDKYLEKNYDPNP